MIFHCQKICYWRLLQPEWVFMKVFFLSKKNLFTAETSEVCQSSTFCFSTFKPIRTDHRELRNFLLLSKHYYQTVVTIWGFEQIKWNIKEMLKKKDFNFVIQTILKHIIKHYFLRFFLCWVSNVWMNVNW